MRGFGQIDITTLLTQSRDHIPNFFKQFVGIYFWYHMRFLRKIWYIFNGIVQFFDFLRILLDHPTIWMKNGTLSQPEGFLNIMICLYTYCLHVILFQCMSIEELRRSRLLSILWGRAENMIWWQICTNPTYAKFCKGCWRRHWLFCVRLDRLKPP